MHHSRAQLALATVFAVAFGWSVTARAQDDFGDFGPAPAPANPAPPPASDADFDDDFGTNGGSAGSTREAQPPASDESLPDTSGAATTTTETTPASATAETTPEATPTPRRGQARASTPARNATSDEVLARRQLRMQNTFYGPVGGIRAVDAGSGPVGTFRLSLMTEFMFLADFLEAGDYAKYVGGALAASWTAHRNLEVFASYQSTASWNTLGDPELVQALGDVQLGAKAFASVQPWLRLGGDVLLRFPNPVGNVGVAFRGTSVGLRGNLTFDLRRLPSRSIPFVARVNAQYYFDNSVNLVSPTEDARYAGLEAPRPRNEEPRSLVTDIERFALGINRTDFVNLRFGFETPIEISERFQIDPMLEWLWAIPVNRTGFVCPYLAADDEGCLDRSGVSSFPMTLTLGARVHPIVRGLSLSAAVDVGLTGTRDITRELAPTMPYAVVLGASYAYDPAARATATERVVERVVEVPAEVAVRGHVLATIVETGAGTPVEGAIVRFEGRDVNAIVADSSGRARSYPFEPGDVMMSITHPDYVGGTCVATIPATRPAAVAPGDAATVTGTATVTATTTTSTTTGTDASGASASASVSASTDADSSTATTGTTGEGTDAGADPAATRTATLVAPESLEIEVEVRCELEARPRTGSANIIVVTDTGRVERAHAITIEGPATQTITTDASGNARLADVPPGHYTARIEADGFFVNQHEFDVAPRGNETIELTLVTRPRRSLVRLAGRRIQILRQVNFVTDSDEILPTSDGLLYEVADTLTRHPELLVVEIEGHTDDRGGGDHNLDLSQRRAESVRRWLITHGVAESRLTARGYGLTRPLVPNITPGNRARNRRVQFTVRESNDEGN